MYKFYVHSFPIKDVVLPDGWESRVIKVVDDIGLQGFVGWCVEPHDLAANKLAAFRDKDRDFVRTLLIEDLIDAEILEDRLRVLQIDPEHLARLQEWLHLTIIDLLE